jgi:hypothetical protein
MAALRAVPLFWNNNYSVVYRMRLHLPGAAVLGLLARLKIIVIGKIAANQAIFKGENGTNGQLKRRILIWNQYNRVSFFRTKYKIIFSAASLRHEKNTTLSYTCDARGLLSA